MWNALFAYEDPVRAQGNVDALMNVGIPSSEVRVHRRGSGQPGGAVDSVDEQVTGGVLSNLFNLFQGVMDWGNSPHDASSFEAVVNRGGAVLDVQARDERARDLIDSTVAGNDLRTSWRETH